MREYKVIISKGLDPDKIVLILFDSWISDTGIESPFEM